MDTLVSKQFALGSIFGLMIMVAAMAGLAYRFDLQGFVFGIDFVVVLWILASFSGARSLRPFSNRHLSIAEIATMAAICLILHGLAMPAVQSGPHRRRATTPVTVPPASGGTAATAPTP
jgi:hypothetical protein